MCVGDYLFVKCENEDNETRPPIVKVEKTYPGD